ncbi:hypothetical protein DFH08DRAFT_812309 [Mycena albidolilacea]|uniref:Uncharacterized protein n=1 Tax=Mycena albidolilacea TaxID=1033008 RepID=A0AAD6ZUD3_9AGAR|nr:hypothetical protein DFH08DRAFT_812309 [Mycena albidolilacea]
MQLASISSWAFLLVTVAAPALVFFIGQLAFHSGFLRTTSNCDAWVERYFQLSEDVELDDVEAARGALVEKFRIALWYTFFALLIWGMSDTSRESAGEARSIWLSESHCRSAGGYGCWWFRLGACSFHRWGIGPQIRIRRLNEDGLTVQTLQSPDEPRKRPKRAESESLFGEATRKLRSMSR